MPADSRGQLRGALCLALAVVHLIVAPVDCACPCLSSSRTFAALRDDFVNSDGDLEYEGHIYPSAYGADSCDAHDDALPPYCADSDGDALEQRPEWCADRWCWVDKDNCDASVVTPSAYFPSSGLYFSYAACGSQNTFNSWFKDSNSSDFNNHELRELADVVEGYVFGVRNQIEDDIASISGRSGCSTNNCVCGSDCAILDGWGIEPVNLGSTIFKADAGETAADMSECMASLASAVYLRIAGLEFINATRVGFQYAGFQADGAYLQWPRQDWCESYDPRFRPWYAAAASAPKNVVIVVDVSGSMGEANRIGLARSAVSAVVDTLTWKDHVTIIEFNGEHALFSETLVGVTDQSRADMKVYAENLRAAGGTNFVTPLSRALSILEDAETGACYDVILFMTDGAAAFSGSDYEDFAARADKLDAVVFTYALGAGADTAVTQRLACENRGVAHVVDDGSDLASAMSSYYTYFTAGTGYRGVRWVQYTDVTIGANLLAACAAIYDLRGENAELNVLLGVTCMDVNVIVDLATLEERSDFDDFMAEVNAASDTCSGLFGGKEGDELQEVLEDVRARLEGEGATLCGSAGLDGPAPGEVGVLVGIIVGVLCGVCALCCVAYLAYRYVRRRGDKAASRPPQQSAPPQAPQQQPPAYSATAYAQQPPVTAYAQQPPVTVQGFAVAQPQQPMIVTGTVIR